MRFSGHPTTRVVLFTHGRMGAYEYGRPCFDDLFFGLFLPKHPYRQAAARAKNRDLRPKAHLCPGRPRCRGCPLCMPCLLCFLAAGARQQRQTAASRSIPDCSPSSPRLLADASGSAAGAHRGTGLRTASALQRRVSRLCLPEPAFAISARANPSKPGRCSARFQICLRRPGRSLSHFYFC